MITFSLHRNRPRLMYIASWNVAGWLTTVRHIKANHGSVDAWLGRHAFDVLCLQEVKTNERNLEQKPSEHAVAPEGFDSFWAPSRLRTAKGGFSGMAGVATFVRKGLCHHASRNVLDGGGHRFSKVLSAVALPNKHTYDTGF
jgi:exonuclease III